MAPPIHLNCAAFNDVAFALLEQYMQGKISQMLALTNIDVELTITGIPFDEEEWLNLIRVILMNPTEGLDSIKAAQQLTQAKIVPLLEDAAAWQLVLQWAGDDSLPFDSFLKEMQDRYKERYKFDKWKPIFDQVFEASHEGTAVEVVRAAMAEHGVLNPPSVPGFSSQASSSGKLSCRPDGSPPPAKHPRLNWSVAQFLDVSAQDDEEEEDEDGDEDNLDIEADHHPRVAGAGPLGLETFNEHLQDLACHYEHEGSVTGSNA
ncbi:hypothetical protein EDD16DRAFT_1714618 [Pisolithus croceorrhizus]|nr:hypothetical protein EV401DRAFT_2082926 [Pisolithus croceorrhizus]KAI6104559.1 hypothetical protein EDD16DRAFT_1714618 [Pisolithus croceorrhizus]KAI6140549.1 hypothetical protein EDD17DRAFT_1770065 [Pisolithus thermaeus]